MVVNTFILNIQSRKINLLLMARPLRPPLELNGRLNVGTLGKKGSKKVIFSLLARPYTPPPLLMAPLLREELFFCGFPYQFQLLYPGYFIKKRPFCININRFFLFICLV